MIGATWKVIVLQKAALCNGLALVAVATDRLRLFFRIVWRRLRESGEIVSLSVVQRMDHLVSEHTSGWIGRGPAALRIVRLRV